MRQDFHEIRGMGQETLIQDNFPLRQEARREDLIAGPGAVGQAAAIGAHGFGETDR